MGGILGRGGEDRRVSEYNPRKNTWRNMPGLQKRRYSDNIVCTLDTKIFALGGQVGTACEVLDLSGDNPHWKFIASINSKRRKGGVAVLGERKIYLMGGSDTSVEVYDEDQGILMEFLQIDIFVIYR